MNYSEIIVLLSVITLFQFFILMYIYVCKKIEEKEIKNMIKYYSKQYEYLKKCRLSDNYDSNK